MDSDCTENNEKSGHSCLIPAVRESAFHLSLGGMLVIGLLNADFIMSNYVCSIAGVSRDFYPIETLNLGKAPPMSVMLDSVWATCFLLCETTLSSLEQS